MTSLPSNATSNWTRTTTSIYILAHGNIRITHDSIVSENDELGALQDQFGALNSVKLKLKYP
jgi:hypothetical protein